MRVLMTPPLSAFDNHESGIKRVIEAWIKHAPAGIEFVECNVEREDLYDLFVIHAGSVNRYPAKRPIVSALHGLYWTSDYQASAWEWAANSSVIESIRRATSVTVPSNWVAETLQRDFRINPTVVHHGIDWKLWEHEIEPKGYVLWNKNRNADVCSPYPVGQLAKLASDVHFITTFAPPDALKNVTTIGLQSHDTMKTIVQGASVYLSTTKETFGIGILEALAAGVPVLGFRFGGNVDIVEHGVNGYLAHPNNYDDLLQGLRWCIEHREVLSNNARTSARKWDWKKPMQTVAEVFEKAFNVHAYNQRPLRLDAEVFLKNAYV